MIEGSPSALFLLPFYFLAPLLCLGILSALDWADQTNSDVRTRKIRLRVSFALLGGWLALNWLGAWCGIYSNFQSRPPTLVLAFGVAAAIVIWVALGPIGSRLKELPIWALIGMQVFRLPLELGLHQGFVEGAVPIQMTYSGYNFDALTGLSAGILALVLRRWALPKSILMAWNSFGLGLLITIFFISVSSTPTFALFGSASHQLNTFVSRPPFVWLPTFFVPVALLGHLLLLRRLSGRRR